MIDGVSRIQFGDSGLDFFRWPLLGGVGVNGLKVLGFQLGIVGQNLLR